jgi:hypothetical protein
MTALANVTQLPTTTQTAPRKGGNLGSIRAIIPRTYQEVAAMAQATCKAGIARKYDNDPSKVAAVMMSGMELGLKPLAALRLFWVSPEGQPSLSARGQLAVVQNSGLMESWEDRFEGEGDDRTAIIAVRRRGLPGIVRRFSMADARKAGLLNKQNWSKYADRMLWNRAVSFALNDQFADLLGGLYEPSEIGGPVLDDDGAVIEPEAEAPKVAKIEVLMPGMDPEYFPQTKRGLDDLVRFIADTVLDGGAGVVLLNVELLDRLAKAGYADAIAEIRAEANKRLRGEPDEPDTADDADDDEAED